MAYCIAHAAVLNVMWQPGWEGSLGESGYVYVPACVLSQVWLFAPHGLGPARLLCPWNFPGKKYWSGLPFPTPGDLSDLGIELKSLVSSALAVGFLYQLSYQRNPDTCMKSESVSPSVVSNSLPLHGLSSTTLFCSWNSPDKNTGVGCHPQGIFTWNYHSIVNWLYSNTKWKLKKKGMKYSYILQHG